MPTDLNGNYSLPPAYLAATGTAIQIGQHNPPLEDIFRHVANQGMGLDQGRSGKLGDDAIEALSGGVR